MSLKVLVIEDNESIAQLIQRGLELAGHQVRIALDGLKILEAFDVFAPDLVITDLMMPEADTIDTIRECRRRRPDTKVIAISGNEQLLSVAGKNGADHLLAKPFGPLQLNAVVAALLD